MIISSDKINYLAYKTNLPKSLIKSLSIGFKSNDFTEILNFYKFCNDSVYSHKLRRSGESYFNHISRMATHSIDLGLNDKLLHFYFGIHDLEEENISLIKSKKNKYSNNNLRYLINSRYGDKLEKIMDTFTPKKTNRNSKLGEKIFQSEKILTQDDIRLGICKFFDTYDNTRDLENLKFESLKGKLGQIFVLTDYFDKLSYSNSNIKNLSSYKFKFLKLLSKRENEIKLALNLI